MPSSDTLTNADAVGRFTLGPKECSCTGVPKCSIKMRYLAISTAEGVGDAFWKGFRHGGAVGSLFESEDSLDCGDGQGDAHRAIEITFRCDGCTKQFIITYESGKKKERRFGRYMNIRNVVWTVEVRRAMTWIDQMFEEMDGPEKYRSISNHCGHWAMTFWNLIK